MGVSEQHPMEPEEDTREIRTDGVVTWRWPPREMPEDFSGPEDGYPLIEWPNWLKRLFRRGDAAP